MLSVPMVISDLEQDTITLSDGTISVGVTVLGANSSDLHKLDFSITTNSMYILPIL